jgi:hypothetical protein
MRLFRKTKTEKIVAQKHIFAALPQKKTEKRNILIEAYYFPEISQKYRIIVGDTNLLSSEPRKVSEISSEYIELYQSVFTHAFLLRLCRNYFCTCGFAAQNPIYAARLQNEDRKKKTESKWTFLSALVLRQSRKDACGTAVTHTQI